MPLILQQLGKKNIWIKHRDKDGKVSVEIIKDMTPYFYDDNKNKIFVDKPADVKEARKKFAFTHEADINYSQRFIIDRLSVPFPDEPLRISYFDIETNKCLDSENTPEPVISCTFYDNFLKKFVVFVWRKDLKTLKYKKVIEIPEYKFKEEVSIYKFDNEVDFLEKIITFIESTDPDVLACWNSGGEFSGSHPFDFPYLINRMKLLKVNCNRMSPLRYISIEEFWNRISIRGRVTFDLME